MKLSDLRILMDDVFFPQMEYWPFGIDGTHGIMYYNKAEDWAVIDENGVRHNCKGNRYGTYLGPELFGSDDELYSDVMKWFWNNEDIMGDDEDLPPNLAKATLKGLKRWSKGVDYTGKKEKKGRKFKGVCMYTICPKNRIGISEGEVWKFINFVKKLETFDFYEEFVYAVESGKKENSPNLHCHIVLKFKPGGSKNFADRVKKWFKKSFPDNTVDYCFVRKDKSKNKGIDCKDILNQEIWEEKIRYLNNKNKHEFGYDHTRS